MKILHVTRETGNNARYGIRKSLTPALEALRQRGHEAVLFDQDMANNIPVGKLAGFAERLYFSAMHRRFGNEGGLAMAVLTERVKVAQAAARYAARHQMTHVHCHDPLLAYAYAFFAPFYGASARWGYSAHAYGRFVQLRMGVETSPDSLAYLQKWENQAAQKAAWVITLSRGGMEQMARDLNLPFIPGRWHVVPHAVEKPALGDRNLVRQGLGIAEHETLLLAVGQLIPLKRFPLLLDAVALLPSALRPHVLLLGEGEERAHLQTLAEQLGLTGHFDIRVTDNIGEYLAAADIYASVSSTESYGIANCEALITELPSICTAVGAVPEIVGDGALLVGEQPEQIASALNRLLTSEQAKGELVEKAKQQVKQWPTSGEVASMLETIYANNE